jgi:hypothetical protein
METQDRRGQGMSWHVQDDLVFDLGLHKGYDAELL